MLISYSCTRMINFGSIESLDFPLLIAEASVVWSKFECVFNYCSNCKEILISSKNSYLISLKSYQLQHIVAFYADAWCSCFLANSHKFADLRRDLTLTRLTVISSGTWALKDRKSIKFCMKVETTADRQSSFGIVYDMSCLAVNSTACIRTCLGLMTCSAIQSSPVPRLETRDLQNNPMLQPLKYVSKILHNTKL